MSPYLRLFGYNELQLGFFQLLSPLKHNPQKLGLNPKFIFPHVTTQTVKASTVPVLVTALLSQVGAMATVVALFSQEFGFMVVLPFHTVLHEVSLIFSTGEIITAEVMRVAQQ